MADGMGAGVIERSGGPYDQRLARVLIRPLIGTPVRPNHLSFVSLGLGIAGALLFALGDGGLIHWAALLSVLAVFSDHLDGELARMTGRTSEFGHKLDYLIGSANYTMLFAGIGWGLGGGLAEGIGGGLGIGLERHWYYALGFAAGLSNPLIVTLRMAMDRRFGAEAVEHPSKGGFELEDFIYLIGPITWAGGLVYFFVLYGLGNLGYLAWTIYEYRRNIRRAKTPPGA
ncbi:MAG: CDP-alcohol phosphatidyltransferase family protein [Alphaproteobacteria bacterium]